MAFLIRWEVMSRGAMKPRMQAINALNEEGAKRKCEALKESGKVPKRSRLVRKDLSGVETIISS